MKVLAFNGSPRKEGNTFYALQTVAKELEADGIEVEVVHVGGKTISGCMACGACSRNKNERCIIENDDVNTWIQKMKEADGILIGSPVHFSGISGAMKCFLDRAFYVASSDILRHKVAAAVVAVRRSGGVTTFDQLNHYLHYAQMLVPSSNYWNVIHGAKPYEAAEDAEGVQIMQNLGKNMAWMLRMVEVTKDTVVEPVSDKKIYTNFVR